MKGPTRNRSSRVVVALVALAAALLVMLAAPAIPARLESTDVGPTVGGGSPTETQPPWTMGPVIDTPQAALSQSTVQPSPTESPSHQVWPQPSLADAFGVQIISPSHFAPGAEAIREAGAEWIHLGIEWRQLAPTDTTPVNEYDWEPFDIAMNTAREYGFRVMVTLGGNPCWAASFSRGPVDRVDISRFVEYVEAVVRRYKDIVHYWAIYNEPDAASVVRTAPDCRDPASTMLNAFGDHPQEYVDALRIAFQTIRSIDPNASVVLGGIAFDNFSSEGGPFVADFLAEILSRGAGEYFDIMNFHYYPDYDWRWERDGLPGIVGKTLAIRQLLEDHGLDKPIICSELGDSSGQIYPGDARSRHTQARAVIMLYARAFSAGIGLGVWYNMNDYQSPNDPFRFHGLLDAEYRPKPALSSYHTLASCLRDQVFQRALGRTEWGASNVEGYLFQNESQSGETIILWSRDGSTQVIALPAGVTSVLDMFGEPKPFGEYLPIDGDPVFILRDGDG